MPITLVTTPVRALVRAANSGVKTKETQIAVRCALLILAVLCSTAAPAKDRQWKDAKVIDITSEKGEAVIVPIAAFVGVPVAKTYYWIQTADTIYVLGPGRPELSSRAITRIFWTMTEKTEKCRWWRKLRARNPKTHSSSVTGRRQVC
jgi:hypothetical protein